MWNLQCCRFHQRTPELRGELQTSEVVQLVQNQDCSVGSLCRQDLSGVSFFFGGLPRRVRLCAFYNIAFLLELRLSGVVHIGPRPRSLSGFIVLYFSLLLFACV